MAFLLPSFAQKPPASLVFAAAERQAGGQVGELEEGSILEGRCVEATGMGELVSLREV